MQSCSGSCTSANQGALSQCEFSLVSVWAAAEECGLTPFHCWPWVLVTLFVVDLVVG